MIPENEIQPGQLRLLEVDQRIIVLGKLPHAQGQLKFWIDRARGTGGKLIEYK